MADSQPQTAASEMQQEAPKDYGRPVLYVSYKLAFRSRLQVTLNSITHFLRTFTMSQQAPAFDAEFRVINSSFRDINSYCEALQLFYMKPASQGISHDRWKVTEIVTYKNQGDTAKHEYFVATVKDDHNHIVHLRIQRRIQKPKVSRFLKWSRGSTNRATSASGSSSSEDSPNSAGQAANGVDRPPPQHFKKKALDDIEVVNPFDISDPEVDIIHFEEDQISLPRLAILARSMNNLSSQYHLLTQNCYWFAYTAAEALKHLHAHKTLPVTSKVKQGHWNSLPATIFFSNFNISQLLEEYNTKWEEFKAEIDSTVNNPNNKHVQEAQEREEKERHKRVEAEQRAAEIVAEKDNEIKRLQAKLAEAEAKASPSTTSTCKLHILLSTNALLTPSHQSWSYLIIHAIIPIDDPLGPIVHNYSS
ncbi:hypothetical protein AX17_005166 [Amanita inopinata Kibby_2008]|nr:hypothetical protein AX17_005166 [Amanita inopinata Kibby_2008]